MAFFFFFFPELPYRNQLSAYNSLLDIRGWHINRLKAKYIFSFCKTFPEGWGAGASSPSGTWSSHPSLKSLGRTEGLPSGVDHVSSAFSPAPRAREFNLLSPELAFFKKPSISIMFILTSLLSPCHVGIFLAAGVRPKLESASSAAFLCFGFWSRLVF